MSNYLLDTNIISRIVREDPQITRRFEHLLTGEHLFWGCPLVYFEVKRGLIARDAHAQLKRFEDLHSVFYWSDYHRDDWQLASEIWAKRRLVGRPISDADLLIAVYATNRSAILVTNNTKDFVDLNVQLEDWTV